MVRLHVVNDEVLDRFLANHGLDFGYELLKEADIHRINQRHHLIVDEVGVVRYAIGQRPHPLEEVLVAVVDADIVYFTFY